MVDENQGTGLFKWYLSTRLHGVTFLKTSASAFVEHSIILYKVLTTCVVREREGYLLKISNLTTYFVSKTENNMAAMQNVCLPFDFVMLIDGMF
jgi:hypothetical protein